MVDGKMKCQLSPSELELACHCLVSFLNNRKDSALKKSNDIPFFQNYPSNRYTLFLNLLYHHYPYY